MPINMSYRLNFSSSYCVTVRRAWTWVVACQHQMSIQNHCHAFIKSISMYIFCEALNGRNNSKETIHILSDVYFRLGEKKYQQQQQNSIADWNEQIQQMMMDNVSQWIVVQPLSLFAIIRNFLFIKNRITCVYSCCYSSVVCQFYVVVIPDCCRQATICQAIYDEYAP